MQESRMRENRTYGLTRTGNHTLELAKIFSSVSAIDIDEEMVKIAQKKTKDLENVHIQNIKIENFYSQNPTIALKK